MLSECGLAHFTGDAETGNILERETADQLLEAAEFATEAWSDSRGK
jgi:hypothetical protein